MDYYRKYLKYKIKYIDYKKKLDDMQRGGNSDEPLKNISDANVNFTINIFKNLEGNSNVFSPFSLQFALSILHLAAVGHTNIQLNLLIGHKYSINELKYFYQLFNSNVVQMNNAFIINNKIHISKKYRSEISDIVYVSIDDFDNSQRIVKNVNNFISSKTNGLITDVISEDNINHNTQLILINTIHFKADWQHKFNATNTSEMIFHNEQNKLVNMMHQTNYFNYGEDNFVQIIELPYVDKNYVMGIILPKMNADGKILVTTSELNNIKFIDKITRLKRTRVELFLPKFTQIKKIDMVPVIIKAGTTDIFDSRARFDIMAKNIHVSGIIHEAVVIVDEFGTEAAAVTVVTMEKNAIIPMQEKYITFKADHPFVYYIRYVPSNIFLFYGDYQGANV